MCSEHGWSLSLRHGTYRFWNFHYTYNSSLWTYISPANQTLTLTPVMEQAVFVARNNILHWFEINQRFQGRCSLTIRLHDMHCSGQCWCTWKKARYDVPSMNHRRVQFGMDLWRSSYPPLLNRPVQAGSSTAGCPGPRPGGFLISLRMETPQPLRQPVPVLSHPERKVFLLRDEFSNQFSFF